MIGRLQIQRGRFQTTLPMKQTIGSVETAASCGCGTASDPPGALVTSLKIRRRKVWANTGNVQRDPFCVGPVGAGSCGVCGDEPRPPAARLATAVKFRRNVVQPSWPIIADAPVCGDPVPCCSGTVTLSGACAALGELPQRMWLTVFHHYGNDRIRAWSEPMDFSPVFPIAGFPPDVGWYSRWLGSLRRDTGVGALVCRHRLDCAGLRFAGFDGPRVDLAELPFINLMQYGALLTVDPVFTDAELFAWNHPEEFTAAGGLQVYFVAVNVGDPPPTDYTLGFPNGPIRRGVSLHAFQGVVTPIGIPFHTISVAQVGGVVTVTQQQFSGVDTTPPPPLPPFATVTQIGSDPWIGRYFVGTGGSVFPFDVYGFLVEDTELEPEAFVEPEFWRVNIITPGIAQMPPSENEESLIFEYQIIPSITLETEIPISRPTGAIGYSAPGSCDSRNARISISSTQLKRWSGGVGSSLVYSIAPDWFDPATTTAKFTLPESPPIEILAYGYD